MDFIPYLACVMIYISYVLELRQRRRAEQRILELEYAEKRVLELEADLKSRNQLLHCLLEYHA